MISITILNDVFMKWKQIIKPLINLSKLIIKLPICNLQSYFQDLVHINLMCLNCVNEPVVMSLLQQEIISWIWTIYMSSWTLQSVNASNTLLWFKTCTTRLRIITKHMLAMCVKQCIFMLTFVISDYSDRWLILSLQWA